ncbi:MAG: sseB [Chlorobi bacterium]|nr:sseB [Chlorobiota bacterium]
MRFLSKLFAGSPADDPLDALLADAVRAPELREAFYRRLLAATLMVPGEQRDGELLLRPYDLYGKRSILLFTSRAPASSLRDHPPLVELPARVLLEVSLGFDSVILNYGNRNEKEFTPPEIRGILDGSIFSSGADAGAFGGIMVGQPREYPVRLMNELRSALPSRPDVLRAYIAQVSTEGVTEEPKIVMAFETGMSDDDFELFRGRVGLLAGSVGAEGVHFVRLAADGLGEYLRTETKPFYDADEL